MIVEFLLLENGSGQMSSFPRRIDIYPAALMDVILEDDEMVLGTDLFSRDNCSCGNTSHTRSSTLESESDIKKNIGLAEFVDVSTIELSPGHHRHTLQLVVKLDCGKCATRRHRYMVPLAKVRLEDVFGGTRGCSQDVEVLPEIREVWAT